MNAVTPLLYSVDEAAEALRVSRRTLFAWTKAGDVPHIRRGARVLYPVDELRVWIAKQSREGAAQ